MHLCVVLDIHLYNVQCWIHRMDKSFLIRIKRGFALSLTLTHFLNNRPSCVHIHDVLNTLRKSLMCQKYRYASFVSFATKRHTPNRRRWWYEMRRNEKWKNFICLFQPTKEGRKKRNKRKDLTRVSGEFQITISLLIKCYRIISRPMDIILFYAS